MLFSTLIIAISIFFRMMVKYACFMLKSYGIRQCKAVAAEPSDC